LQGINGTAFSSAGEDYTSVLSATIKYAKMSLWPFALFVPSFFLFSHLIIGMAYTGSNGQSNQPQLRRKQVSWKTLGMTTILLLSLFTFMEAMLAMADQGKWILLVMTSAFPSLMMVLARLSLVSATSNYDVITTACGNNDTTAAGTAAALNSDESSGESV
jgi:heme/copper-type cytochrome/quinol oxidase subunit 3